MKNTAINSMSKWARYWQRLTNFAKAMDYSEAEYTTNRVALLHTELIEVNGRVERLEADFKPKAYQAADKAA